MKKTQCTRKTKIGGQAVIEGVMMRGQSSMALAVRDQQGNIRVDSTRLPAKKPWYSKVPFLRGVINLVVTMVAGMSIIGKSADVYAEEELQQTKSKKDTKSNKQSKTSNKNTTTDKTTFNSSDSNNTQQEEQSAKGLGILMIFSVLLGLAFAIALFIVLPTYVSKWIMDWANIQDIEWARSLIEGGMKLLIFVLYLLVITLMKDVKRVFMYHGAEHMTIACYEHGKPLTVDNVKQCSRYHDRCGTSFLVFVLLLSIVLMFAVEAICYAVGFEQIRIAWVRTLIKIAMLPLTAGFSYEMLMLLARTDFILFRPLKWLGKQFQRLTTRQPDDKMCEVAITAFNTVLNMDNDQTIAERHWLLNVPSQEAQQYVVEYWNNRGYNGTHIWQDLLVNRPKWADKDYQIPSKNFYALLSSWDKMPNDMPMQYISGVAHFYGTTFAVNKDVLIPRPETELVVEHALKHTQDNAKVLDICCGSGAIGVSMLINNHTISVTMADISDKALAVAKTNATKHNVLNRANFVFSDMFSAISGQFDTIVCNPPYIATSVIPTLDSSVKDYEPTSALDGGSDGLDFYRTIATSAHDYLRPNGILVLEIGYDQGDSVPQLMRDNGWHNVQLIKDYSDNARIVVCTNLAVDDKLSPH